MASNIPISTGLGQASVSTEQIGDVHYQRIKVIGAETGSTSVLSVGPDGSAKVSVIGTIATTNTGSVISVPVGSVIAVLQSSSIISRVTGSVVALQGTDPWVIVGSVYGSGSVVSHQGTTPWIIGSVYGNVSGSVVAFQGGANWNVSGSVASFPRGTVITSLVSTVPSSVIVGSSIFGQLPAGTAVLGSVAALQGTNPWDIAGSVAAFQAGTRFTSISGTLTIGAITSGASIVGTYQEDSTHSTGERGIFILGVRNDALPSVTSADGDYSPFVVGPTGEQIVVDAPYTKWVSGVADLRTVLGASVTAIAAQGASVFTYVREVQVANFGPSSVLVKIAGGLGSTLGWTIAPAGGGSNFNTRYKTGENSAVTASINGTASVLVTISGFTAKI